MTKFIRILHQCLWQTMLVAALGCSLLAQVSTRIQSIVVAGTLSSMRWNNFSDYRVSLQNFYGPVGYVPAWLQGNTPTPQAMAMIQRFRDAAQKGLNPEDYDASRWERRINALKNGDDDLADFEVALTVSTMRYISDLHIGRINPQHFNFGLDVDHKKYDLAHFIRERLLTTSDLAALLDSVEPPFPGYRRTEQALARYRELASHDQNEKLLVPAKPIEPGGNYQDLPQLARRLALLGDLPPDAASHSPNSYDATLVEAVKRFQRRHGLDADGRLGPATIKQLNVPLSDRVRQLELTLERWRWLPSEFSAPPIIVNVPDFRLRVLDENYKINFDMRVVVGKAFRTQTPVFSRDMTFVVLRPYWNVPSSILRGEIIPAIKRDRDYITKKNYEVITAGGESRHVRHDFRCYPDATSGGQACGPTETGSSQCSGTCQIDVSE